MKFGWRGALGLVLSAAFLYFAFRGIELQRVLENVRQSNVALLALSALAATCIFPLRARRWKPILEPIKRDIPFSRLWSATAIGMMVNNVVPARAGEFARAFALTRSTPEVPFPASFASLAVDRLFDAVVVFGLMFGAMLDPAFPSGVEFGGRPIAQYAAVGIGIILVVLVAMYGLILFPGRVLSLYELVVRRLVPRLEARGRDALLGLADGLSVLKTPRHFAAVLGWTILHWLTNAFAFWLAFRAVGIPAPFSAALFLQGIIAVGVAVPQAPGFFGAFEGFGKVGLGIYGVPADQAVTWAIGFHFLSYVPITVIGAWYFVREGLSMGDLGGAEREVTEEHPVPSPEETRAP
ncbi:MAG TPA: lysylphosphatidylglycerol synthase transmembrane domain-containing protein [Gemmatimonadaceae bacterium]|nr:lysylphosphatidylglycerol synthase transmembrane domain-containing protein [Gemmatimonadaceae bacterium]